MERSEQIAVVDGSVAINERCAGHHLQLKVSAIPHSVSIPPANFDCLCRTHILLYYATNTTTPVTRTNTDFRFSMLWNHFQPDQARIHLATHCLDHVLARMAGTTHLQTTIQAGESETFSLIA